MQPVQGGCAELSLDGGAIAGVQPLRGDEYGVPAGSGRANEGAGICGAGGGWQGFGGGGVSSLSGHQSARMGSDTWLTPPEIIKALGKFDLDPCCPAGMPWRTAETMILSPDDGLAKAWVGRVWLNPPFGKYAARWLERLARHGNGIALVAARTETRMFFEHVWGKADAVLFLKGRPHFYDGKGRRAPFNSGAPIVLVAYGQGNVHALQLCGLKGAFVKLKGGNS